MLAVPWACDVCLDVARALRNGSQLLGKVCPGLSSNVATQAAIQQLGGAFAAGDAPAVSAARDAPKKLDIVAVSMTRNREYSLP